MTYCSLLVLLFLLSAAPAWAAPAPDLSVRLTPPSVVRVYQPASFNVRVSNLGNRNAAGVLLTIQLPRTQTSPTVHVMGTLGAYSAPCSRSNTALVCPLGTINKNKSTSVFFEIALPYSAAPIVFSASASTTTLPEVNPTNNALTYTASPMPFDAAVSHAAPALNEHCTGQPSLSSYFECVLYPSSITSHETTFNANGSLTFFNGPATMNGTWTHAPSTDRLQFWYYDGAQLEAQFDGRGVSAKCFEGKTTFPSSPDYVSLYRVCFP